MTMFPNCRAKFSKDAWPYGERFRKREDIPDDEINPYWDQNLEGRNRTVINGFDSAAYEADTFFANLEVNRKLKQFLTEEEMLQASLIAGEMMQEDEEITAYKFREMTKECPRIVKAILALRFDLAEWMEMERNQYITALIDRQLSEGERQDG